MKLEELREQLDQIDQELVSLFEQRRELCRQVAHYKIEVNKPVLDATREASKIETLRKMAKDCKEADAIEALFHHILSDSRQLQKEIMEMHQA
ncbi:MAG: chorismate mutase [Clostridia bacterium]|nr:chorismate mutase [Clostridia bacterium]